MPEAPTKQRPASLTGDAGQVQSKAVELVGAILEGCAEAQGGAATTAMSLAHIVATLTTQVMRYRPEHPAESTADRLVLSQTHAAPVLRDAFTRLGWGAAPFVEGNLPASGASVAAGLAISSRQADRSVYCILGDGEARSGQFWEAMDLAVEQGLSRLVTIINCNGFGQSDKVSPQQAQAVLQKRLEATGLAVRVVDGHDPAALMAAFADAAKRTRFDAPLVVLARTVKGWGVASMQGGGWHGKAPAADRLAQARAELAATRMRLTSSLPSGRGRAPTPPPESPAIRPALDVPSLPQALKQFDMGAVLGSGRLSTRRAYGVAIRALGLARADVWAVEADSRSATCSEYFALDRALAPRFVECRVAPASALGVACGLAADGGRAFCSMPAAWAQSLAAQFARAVDAQLPVTLVGADAGVTATAESCCRGAIGDVAAFRSFTTRRATTAAPGAYILQPADAFAVHALVRAMGEHVGPCYMRTFRPESELLYSEKVQFTLGGFEVLAEGKHVLIASAGPLLGECLKAVDALERSGVEATLVDLYSLPFDEAAFLDLANAADGRILVVEDGGIGGIHAAVAEACVDSGDAFRICTVRADGLAAPATAAEIAARTTSFLGIKPRA